MPLHSERLHIYTYETGTNFIKAYFNFMNSVYIVYETHCIHTLTW